MALERHLSHFGLLATALCSMIGSGWLFGALIAAHLAGPAAIISWIVGGIMIGIIALVFAELSTMLPVAGGMVRYIHFSHGTCSSFCISWLTWLSCVAVAPTEVSATLHYLANFYPLLLDTTSRTPILSSTGLGCAAGLLFMVTYLNLTAANRLELLIKNIGAWKVLVPILTAIVLMFNHFEPANFTQHGFAPQGIEGILMAISSVVIFSFLGFVEAMSLAGEARNPQKAVPIAIFGSVSISILLYTLLQVAFTGVLSPDALGHGWNTLTFVGDFGPFAGIASTLGLTYLAYTIYADAIISPLGTGIAFTSTTARINYAMSQNRYTPKAMLKLNAQGVPVNAVLCNFFIGLLLLLPFPTWEALIKFQSAAMMLAYGTGPIALIALRQQAPHLSRPFTLPYHHGFAFFALYLCNMILLWTGWDSIWRLLLGLALGMVALLLYRHYQQSDQAPLHGYAALWLFVECIGIGGISYGSTFDGIGVLSLTHSALATAILSAMVLQVAARGQLSRLESQQLLEIT
jgi:amino acid transporter